MCPTIRACFTCCWTRVYEYVFKCGAYICGYVHFNFLLFGVCCSQLVVMFAARYLTSPCTTVVLDELQGFNKAKS